MDTNDYVVFPKRVRVKLSATVLSFFIYSLGNERSLRYTLATRKQYTSQRGLVHGSNPQKSSAWAGRGNSE